MTQTAADTAPRLVPPPLVTGLQFRVVTSFYHSPLEFPYCVADEDGGLYVLQPLEPITVPRDMAEAAVERLGQYGVIDTTQGDLEALRRQALEARVKWLMDNWRFTLATVEQARVKGMVLTSQEDKREFMKRELFWCNEQLGTSYEFPTIETPSPKAEKDMAALQALITKQQEQIAELALRLGAPVVPPAETPKRRRSKDH